MSTRISPAGLAQAIRRGITQGVMLDDRRADDGISIFRAPLVDEVCIPVCLEPVSADIRFSERELARLDARDTADALHAKLVQARTMMCGRAVVDAAHYGFLLPKESTEEQLANLERAALQLMSYVDAERKKGGRVL